jgi:hypothetical protein
LLLSSPTNKASISALVRYSFTLLEFAFLTSIASTRVRFLLFLETCCNISSISASARDLLSDASSSIQDREWSPYYTSLRMPDSEHEA